MDGNCPFSRGRTPTRFEEDRGVTVSYRCDMTDCELWEWGKNRCKLYAAAEAIEGIYQIMANRREKGHYQQHETAISLSHTNPHQKHSSTQKDKDKKGIEI